MEGGPGSDERGGLLPRESRSMGSMAQPSPAPEVVTCKLQFAYGVGHVMNDLCACCWFSFYLVYLTGVEGFSDGPAGVILLVGQLADALSTPTVGLLSDRTTFRLGRRKTWLLIGYVFVGASFPLLFNACFPCKWADTDASWVRTVYTCFFVITFQFGWAATQVSHLALVPELTKDENSQVILTSTRFGFTVFANVTMFVVAFLLLQSTSRSKQPLTAADAPEFHIIGYTAVGVGLIFSFACFIGVHEKPPQGRATSIDAQQGTVEVQRITWRYWMAQRVFYQVGLIYMCSRLIVNVSQVYIQLYVLHSLHKSKTALAEVPLAVYMGQLGTSLVLRQVNARFGRKWTFFMGCAATIPACIILWAIPRYNTLPEDPLLFTAAVLLGVGAATVLVTSLSMEADIIGPNSDSAAFVYGAMSFLDKGANGAAIMVVQHLLSGYPDGSEDRGHFLTNVVAFVPGVAAALALLVLLSLWGTALREETEETDHVPRSGDIQDVHAPPSAVLGTPPIGSYYGTMSSTNSLLANSLPPAFPSILPPSLARISSLSAASSMPVEGKRRRRKKRPDTHIDTRDMYVTP